ncbi:hypothetical protein ES703_23609 [subsurface metagenome]
MEPKYTREQKVTIRSVKNHLYKLKYPDIEEYVRESGTIVESYWIGTSEPYRLGTEVPHISNNYIYRVHLDRQNKLVTIPEEALEPLESED